MKFRLLPLCTLLLVAVSLKSAQTAPRPNILLIVADDLGYHDVGFQGCPDIPTPQLDRLAASGVRCTSGYVSYPVCGPSRAGFITGRYQQRFGHEYNPSYQRDPVQGLPLAERTIADHLRGAGYTTGALGKWHLGLHPQFHPDQRGFDEFFGFLGGGHRYLPGPVGDPEATGPAAEYSSPLLRQHLIEPENGELTTRLGTEAAAFITRHAAPAQPWFLYLAFNAPHTPLQARADMLARFAGIADEKRRSYAAMVATLDEAVGRALAALDATGQRENTLVFFFSDNGGPMTKRNANASRNTPLRGQKGDIFEGGIRVPFVIAWPARLPAGATYEQPVSALDVLPTALAAAGGRADPARPLDGVDLAPFLNGREKNAPHVRLFWRMDGGQAFAVREGDWKWLRTYNNAPQLYHLATDLGETRDVIAQHPDIAARLAATVEAWNRELIAPLWSSNYSSGLINQDGLTPTPRPDAP